MQHMRQRQQKDLFTNLRRQVQFMRYMHLLNACLVLRQALFMHLHCAPLKHRRQYKFDKMLPNTS